MKKPWLFFFLGLLMIAAAPARAQFVNVFTRDYLAPESFLEYARKSGYKYVIPNAVWDLATTPDDWVTDGNGQKNGVYNVCGPDSLYTKLKRAFKQAEDHGLRMIPYVEIGSRHSGAWRVTNDYIEWNTQSVEHDSTPEFAATAYGVDVSFQSFLEVVLRAYRDAGVGYPLEYIHIGMDESNTDAAPSEQFMALSSPSDQDYIFNHGNNEGAYYQLYADHVNRRVNAVKSTLGDSVRVMMWADNVDPQHNGGVRDTRGWSRGGNASIPGIQTYKAALEYNMLSVQDNLVLMPWMYEPHFIGRSDFYRPDSTIGFFTDWGYYFSPLVAYGISAAPSTLYYPTERLDGEAKSRQIMHTWVKDASQSKYDHYRVGYAAATYGLDSVVKRSPPLKDTVVQTQYWEVAPPRGRSPWFNMMPELAKKAGFYEQKSDLLQFWTSFGDRYAAVNVSNSYSLSLSYSSNTFLGNSDSVMAGFPAHLNGDDSGDFMEDMIVVRKTPHVVDAYRSDGAGYTLRSTSNLTGVADSVMRYFTGDVNGDGRTDLIEIYHSNTHNHFGYRAYVSDSARYTLFFDSTNVQGYGALDPAIGGYLTGDMNADGFTDIFHLWADSLGYLILDVHASNGKGLNFWSSSFLPHPIAAVSGVIDTRRMLMGDFDGDGMADIYQVINNAGTTYISVLMSKLYSYSNDIQFSCPFAIGASGDYYTADLNGDGKIDVLQIIDNGHLAVRKYIAGGSNFTSDVASYDLGDYHATSKYKVIDYNGDGKSDLVELYDDGSTLYANIFVSDGSDLTYQTTEYFYKGDDMDFHVTDFDGNP